MLDCLSSPDAFLNQNRNLKSAPRIVGARALLNLLLALTAGVQLTKRRMRTFITSPKAKNTKAVADPP